METKTDVVKKRRTSVIGGRLACNRLENAVESDATGEADGNSKSIGGVVSQITISDQSDGLLHTVSIDPSLEIGVTAIVDSCGNATVRLTHLHGDILNSEVRLGVELLRGHEVGKTGYELSVGLIVGSSRSNLDRVDRFGFHRHFNFLKREGVVEETVAENRVVYDDQECEERVGEHGRVKSIEQGEDPDAKCCIEGVLGPLETFEFVIGEVVGHSLFIAAVVSVETDGVVGHLVEIATGQQEERRTVGMCKRDG